MARCHPSRSFALLAALLVILSSDGIVFVDATATATATTTPPWFNGYYVYGANGSPTTDSITCAKTLEWVTSAAYANCCPTSSSKRCAMPTKCVNNVVYMDDDSSGPCPGDASCATITIYEASPFVLPSATNIFCANGWSANTIYRKLPLSSSYPRPPSTEQNKAWIAGPIIGGVAALGLILACVLFLYTRRRRKRRQDISQAARDAEEAERAKRVEADDQPRAAAAAAVVVPPEELDHPQRLSVAHELPGSVRQKG
ncbi:hypothetical protein AJ80_07961 [Polytolypa hystricis UAMH7299]|uniref:Gram-positive cocci surface proteins LPxTG domain-containing protein n=1 Tax=Polytolypa hystricis (strain UAMH7299) TaxID=1447883 RepID=A0A2B7XF28_POLH7|nr:hypothetical protein AJ80_07961 [Polytolypa hystricis UAMH7299]